MINFIKRLARLLRKEKKSKLSVVQINELIELNKDSSVQLNDNVDYDGMGNYGRFPPIEKVVKKRKLHNN
jgi:hypothetical protein